MSLRVEALKRALERLFRSGAIDDESRQKRLLDLKTIFNALPFEDQLAVHEWAVQQEFWPAIGT